MRKTQCYIKLKTIFFQVIKIVKDDVKAWHAKLQNAS